MAIEFDMWSPFHYFMIIFPFILALFLFYLVKDKPEQTKRNFALALSIIMIAILIMRNVYIWYDHGVFNPEVIPLQICHFASFILLMAAISKDKVWGTIFWCLNFPAGIVSVVFADGLEKYPSMINIQAFAYISGHMLIVTAGLFLLLAGLVKINWASMKKMYVFVGISYVLSVLVNSWFNYLFSHTDVDSNYFYTFKPELGTPLEDMFNLGSTYITMGITYNPVYLVLLAIVGGFILTVMYGLYRILAIINTKHISASNIHSETKSM